MPATAQLPAEAPASSRPGVSRAEAIAYLLIALISAVIILQRNGTLPQLMGSTPTSAYGKFERAVFGTPSLNTVRGVEHFLQQLKQENKADASDADPSDSAVK